MEVMNSAEFEENSVLIGQQLGTKAFGVSDDPMLMSMLSTGLYQYPLKTMLQEISFNAWDAHRMGNCQDRPIDIYMNETTGLIVRDYGPGISPDDIQEIYCIYGNSTKRDDTGQTGGFGLGSKSPFAYTDTFTVTSHHNGKKSMYLVKRSVEENGGGPGMTILMQDIPTEESGLVVTVPFKNERDMEMAKDHLEQIFYLSGIYANVHYCDEEMLSVQSQKLAAGEFIFSTERRSSYESISAVYGGVKYNIPEEDTYVEQFKFFRKLTRTLGDVYIGFAPNSLTPLPNREGLNMSERSVESVQTMFEKIQENVMDILEPAAKVAFRIAAKRLKDSGMPLDFAKVIWSQIEDKNFKNRFDTKLTEEEIEGTCPDTVSKVLWNSVLNCFWGQTSDMLSLMTSQLTQVNKRTYRVMKTKAFLSVFPECKNEAYSLYKVALSDDGLTSYYGRRDNIILVKSREKSNTVLNQHLYALRNHLGMPRIEFRANTGDGNWNVLTSARGLRKKIHEQVKSHKEAIVKKMMLSGVSVPSTVPQVSQFWVQKKGQKSLTLFLKDHIIVARSLKELSENYQRKVIDDSFLPGIPEYRDTKIDSFSGRRERIRANSSLSHNRLIHHSGTDPIMAVIIRESKFDEAVTYLRSRGMTVHEIEKLEKEEEVITEDSKAFIGPKLPSLTAVPTITVAKKRGAPTFPLVNTAHGGWVDSKAPEASKPQGYFCCTETKINQYYGYDRPDKRTMNLLLEQWPRLSVLHSKSRESTIIRRGVPHIKELTRDYLDKIFADDEYGKVLYAHYFMKENSNFPDEVLALPPLQQLMKVPYLRTKQKKKFSFDTRLISASKDRDNEYFFPVGTKRKVMEWESKMSQMNSLSLVQKACVNTHLFNEDVLSDLCRSKKPGEIKVLGEKIARFLRTV